jgi:hypothetical protein
MDTKLAEPIMLSESAMHLLRRLVLTDDRVEVTPDNKEDYRELAAAGIMYPVSGMTRGPEANFRFTDEGWGRRHEILARPAGSP